jgi:precorrin-3B synthase
MTTLGLTRGWCPSLFRPMESGDGWLVRVRPQCGVITAELALAVAEAASRFGNGIIEVTNRANLQIRGLTPATIAPFTAVVEAAGGAAGEGSRVLVSPLLGADASLAAETGEILRAIDAGFASPACLVPRAYPLEEALPAKFGILLDGGGALPLAGIALDITIRFRDGDWSVNGMPCAPAAIPARVLALASTAPRLTVRNTAAPAPGFHSLGETGFALLTPAFGQMSAAAFTGLAELAARYGDGAMRPTPWKSLCIAGVGQGDSAALLDAAAVLGLITSPADSRLSLVTCAGAPACARGEAETHRAAADIARARNPGGSLLHLSGCAKGCAHPGVAPVTLVGRGGHFDLIRNGRASDIPDIPHLALAQIPALMQSLTDE